MKTDLYQKVTDGIVASLEQGVRPWMKPWNAEHAAGRITRPLRANGIAYQGINVLVLWGEAMPKGYSAPIWMTFRQALELNAHVRKGEQRQHGCLCQHVHPHRHRSSRPARRRNAAIPFLKSYTVFNVEQIEGLPAHFHALAEPRLDPVQRIERAETFFAAHRSRYPPWRQSWPITISVPTSCRCRPSRRSAMPKAITPRWRMNAPTGRATNPASTATSGARSWGDAGYAMEELVAELGSAFLCADLDLTPEVREDHAAYIATWLEVLKNDKRAIFSAAAHAQKAADYLIRLQTKDSEPAAA